MNKDNKKISIKRILLSLGIILIICFIVGLGILIYAVSGIHKPETEGYLLRSYEKIDTLRLEKNISDSDLGYLISLLNNCNKITRYEDIKEEYKTILLCEYSILALQELTGNKVEGSYEEKKAFWKTNYQNEYEKWKLEEDERIHKLIYG